MPTLTKRSIFKKQFTFLQKFFNSYIEMNKVLILSYMITGINEYRAKYAKEMKSPSI